METNEVDATSTRRENLNRTFLEYERAICLGDCAANLGDDFARIMDGVARMSNTFGLCGVLVLHAGLLLMNPLGSTIIPSVRYCPRRLKKNFDRVMCTGKGQRPVDWFYQDILMARPTRSFDVISLEQLNLMFSGLRQTEFIVIAVLANFSQPPYSGIHTHWLAAKEEPCNKILLVGDLTPFGLNNIIGIRVQAHVLADAMKNVIGARSTNNERIQVREKGGGRVVSVDEGNTFMVNAFAVSYTLITDFFETKRRFSLPPGEFCLYEELPNPHSVSFF